MQQLPCLVIGKGEMGRLAVSALQKEGCKVTMTLRNHHSRESVIPANCRVLNYDERIEKINQFRVVISATLSPHQTIKNRIWFLCWTISRISLLTLPCQET